MPDISYGGEPLPDAPEVGQRPPELLAPADID